MSDLNLFWTIAENYLLARFETFRPEPESFVDSISNEPGAFVRVQGGMTQIYRSPIEINPTVAFLEQMAKLEKARLQEEEFVDKGRLEGLFYDIEIEKAEKSFQKSEENQETTERSTGETVSRLKSLYGANFEIRNHYEDETKQLNTKRRVDNDRPNED